jgi:hypothetical protein
LLSVTVNDTAEQTRRVLADLASEREDHVDRTPWHELQSWLERAEHRVRIPYASALAELVPPAAVRLRRDFGALLSLVRAHAILHRLNRPRDEQGRIVASLEDYDIVRELVADLMAEGVEATVPATVRESVATVADLVVQHPDGVGLSELGRVLKLDKSAVSRRARSAASRGYLLNREDKRGKPARYVLGEPLPDELELLPSVDTVRDRCTVAGVSGGNKTPANGAHITPLDTPATLQHPSERDSAQEPEDERERFNALKSGLGAVESETLDLICARRQEGKDFTSISGELNRRGFPPPLGSDRWDLVATVRAYGIRRP